MTINNNNYLCDEDIETGTNIKASEIDDSLRLPKNIKKNEVAFPRDAEGWLEEQNKARKLPKAAVQMYGCLNCEWKGTVYCPFQLMGKQQHNNLICDYRKNYLLTLQRKERYNEFSEWQRDINKSLINIQASKDYFRFKQIENQLISAESDPNTSKEEEQQLMNKAKCLRYDWLNLVQYITTLEDKQVDRDTARKHDVNIKQSMSVTEFHKMINGENENSDTVDAEYEEIDEDLE